MDHLLGSETAFLLRQLLVEIFFIVQFFRRAEKRSLLGGFLHAHHRSCSSKTGVAVPKKQHVPVARRRIKVNTPGFHLSSQICGGRVINPISPHTSTCMYVYIILSETLI